MAKATVFKTERRIYYTRSLKHPNRWGNVESACSCLEITWNIRLPNGGILAGFDRRRDAVEACKKIYRKGK
jgi:hypothetical protein